MLWPFIINFQISNVELMRAIFAYIGRTRAWFPDAGTTAVSGIEGTRHEWGTEGR